MAYVLAHPNATIGEIRRAIDDFDVRIFDVVAGTIEVALYFSTRMDALKAMYPESAELAGPSDETRVVVSEPLGDLAGAWNEVPEAHVGIIQPGEHELRPFTPTR